MASADVHLHGGPLDGAVRPAPLGPDGQPPTRTEFEFRDDGALWYVEYRRDREAPDGWHFAATGIAQRADEE